ncbi:lantibiotic (srt) production protein [Streptococcus suis]|nr:helical hairpin domain-containing protein [Streptococcus suis]MBY5010372.1 lantibiotic (srt) production protein [Streptococcus suis]
MDKLNKDILKLHQKLGNNIDKYERLARRLETFVKILNNSRDNHKKLQDFTKFVE